MDVLNKLSELVPHSPRASNQHHLGAGQSQRSIFLASMLSYCGLCMGCFGALSFVDLHNRFYSKISNHNNRWTIDILICRIKNQSGPNTNSQLRVTYTDKQRFCLNNQRRIYTRYLWLNNTKAFECFYRAERIIQAIGTALCEIAGNLNLETDCYRMVGLSLPSSEQASASLAMSDVRFTRSSLTVSKGWKSKS